MLLLRGRLEEPARIYGRGETGEEIYNAPETRYGISLQQEKECLLGLSRDPQVSVSDFAIEIEHRLKLAPPSLPATEQDLLTIEHLVRTLNN